jgi:hypothetical protein
MDFLIMPKKHRLWIKDEFKKWWETLLEDGRLAPYKNRIKFYLQVREQAMERIDYTLQRALHNPYYDLTAQRAEELAELTNTRYDLWAPGGNLKLRREAVKKWKESL